MRMGKYRDNVSKKGNGAQERCHHRGRLAGVAFACISGIPLIVGLLCFDDWSSFFFRRIIGMADKVDFVYFITLRDTSSVQTLGKAPITLGKGFAECDTRQLLWRRSRLCRVPFFEHSAKLCRVPKRPRQNKVKTPAKWLLTEALSSARRKDTRQTRCLCRVPDLWHSAKPPSLTSARSLTLGKATTRLKKKASWWLVSKY